MGKARANVKEFILYKDEAAGRQELTSARLEKADIGSVKVTPRAPTTLRDIGRQIPDCMRRRPGRDAHSLCRNSRGRECASCAARFKQAP